MTYKVYRKGNFIIIESSNGIDIFNVPVQNMVINRANNIYPVYDFFDDGNSILSGISISYLNDENGINYSIDEFENFRTTECGYEPLDLNGGNDPNAPATIDFEAKTYYAKLATAAPLLTCAYNNGAGTLTGSSNGILSQNNQTGKIDNVTPVLNDKILVKNQTPATQNGVYVVTQLGNGSNPFILTRVSDYNESSEIYPSVVFISEGSLNNSKYFTQDTENPTIGTDPIVYKVSSVPFPASVIVFVDTTTSAALPACTYANGTVYSTAPGVGATLKANANGVLGTINGVSIASGNRIIVKNQANQAHNGVYTVTDPGVAGGSGRPWILTRTVADSNSLYRSREFAVTNPSSTLFGSRWTIISPLTMTNANWGTTNIVFSDKVKIISDANGSGDIPFQITQANSTDNLMKVLGEGTVEFNSIVNVISRTSANDNYLNLRANGSSGVNYLNFYKNNNTLQGGVSVNDVCINASYNNGINLSVFNTGVIVGGNGSIAPATSTALDINSTTGALLLPRLTATEASALTPTNGHLIYVTSTNGTFTSVGFWGYDGSWKKITLA
jgi:hypothetical protein